MVSLTASGALVWSNNGDDRYTGKLEGHTICHVEPDSDGVPQLFVGRRKVVHASVRTLFDTVEGPFAARIRASEQKIIDRAQ